VTNKIRFAITRQLEKTFPERRLFLRSDTETRYLRISPLSQLVAVAGTAMVLGWTIMASAIILMDTLGSGSIREQALREQKVYEERMNALAAERDTRAEDLQAAHARFETALSEVSAMQSRLLASEERRNELEKGMEALQGKLRTALAERDGAVSDYEEALARLTEETQSVDPILARAKEIGPAVSFLSEALSTTARERDEALAHAKAMSDHADEMAFEAQLTDERNDRIFTQIEEAVSVSLAPLDDMFKSAGLPADSILETVRRGYAGQGGPLTPVISTKGEPLSKDGERALKILETLDELNVYRIAVQQTPFSEPLKGAYRFTSGFGMRKDPFNGTQKMHSGTDFAGPYGMPVYTTADGVVTFAGWQSGYGRLVKIQHEFGFETRYAHLAKIRVKVGDRVSLGAQIGDMGNSGRSTGTHLHYEVRIGGDPINPMKYIKAARDVF